MLVITFSISCICPQAQLQHWPCSYIQLKFNKLLLCDVLHEDFDCCWTTEEQKWLLSSHSKDSAFPAVWCFGRPDSIPIADWWDQYSLSLVLKPPCLVRTPWQYKDVRLHHSYWHCSINININIDAALNELSPGLVISGAVVSWNTTTDLRLSDLEGKKRIIVFFFSCRSHVIFICFVSNTSTRSVVLTILMAMPEKQDSITPDGGIFPAQPGLVYWKVVTGSLM